MFEAHNNQQNVKCWDKRNSPKMKKMCLCMHARIFQVRYPGITQTQRQHSAGFEFYFRFFSAFSFFYFQFQFFRIFHCETIENATINIWYYIFTMDKLYVWLALHDDRVEKSNKNVFVYFDECTHTCSHWLKTSNWILNDFNVTRKINPINPAFCVSHFP